jgi:acetyl-CoA carboxylase carboxyl transferase subunit alpha
MPLDFEKPIIELENKIEELKKFSSESDIDLTGEINKLENKAIELKKETYSNLTPWQKVTIARLFERPTAEDYIQRIFTDFFELHGDRHFGDDGAIVGGIAKLNGMPVTVVAEQKGRDTKENIKRNFGMPHPEGYRKALRLMEQAEKFNRPIICFVDTPGAYPGIGAEERGQSEAIAKNLFEMSKFKTPIISIIIGEGGSGGALALAVGDKVYMLEHSIYSILSPEGFASIIWKDSEKAPEAAEIMKITAQDLLKYGVIEGVIEEPLGGAHKDVDLMAGRIKEIIEKELSELLKLDKETLTANRYNKFRNIGQFLES